MAKKKIYFGTNTKMYKTIKDTVEFVSQLQELTKDIEPQALDTTTDLTAGGEAIRAAMRLAPGEAMLLLDEICFNRLCHPVMRSLSYYTNFFDFSILRKLL